MAFVLSAAGAPKQAAKVVGACYPQNEFTVDLLVNPFDGDSTGTGKGPINGSPKGSASFTVGEDVTGNIGPPFKTFAHTPGTMAGTLDFTLKGSGPYAHGVHFHGMCIQASMISLDVPVFVVAGAQPDLGPPPPSVDIIKTTFEGLETGAPWGDGKAVGTITVTQEHQTLGINHPLTVHIGLKHASTCHDLAAPGYSLSFDSKKANGSFYAGDGSAPTDARANLPSGVTPSFTPCTGVVLP